MYSKAVAWLKVHWLRSFGTDWGYGNEAGK